MTRPRRSRNTYTPGWSGSARRCWRMRSTGSVSTAIDPAIDRTRAPGPQLEGLLSVPDHMHRTRTTIVVAVLAALVLCAPASANYRVGLSEQDARVFSQPAWQALKLKRVRYILSWDYYKDAGQSQNAATFLNAAKAANQDVLVMFTAHTGCYVNGKYSKSSVCKAPSKTAYKTAVKTFRKAYPWVKTFAPWNEANHVSQPTSKSPKTAAGYYDVLRKECGSKCKVMAADVL